MSSLVYLGLSLILFAVTFGISFLIMPMVFGAFFELMDDIIDNPQITMSAEWLAIYEQNEDTVQFLVPLIPSMGIVILVIKVLMTASARGRD